MKYIYFTSFGILFSAFVFAGAPKISVIQSGMWRTGATWDLNRLPAGGDTVIVPAGKTLLIDNNTNVSSGDVYVKIYGTLKFINNGKLSVGDNSTVMVYNNASVLGDGQPSETLRIGNNTVYKGDQPAVEGPKMATALTINGFMTYVGSVLPVKFIGFTVARKNSDVLVQWCTAEEGSAYLYQLERSTDAVSWSTIALVTATGNASTLR